MSAKHTRSFPMLSSLFRRRFSGPNQDSSRRTRRDRRARLSLEPLEDRLVMSTVTTSIDNSTTGTLRWAINLLSATNTTINFAPALNGQTIMLSSALPKITQNVTITGPSGGVSVSGNNSYQVFNIANNTTAMINGLTIEN